MHSNIFNKTKISVSNKHEISASKHIPYVAFDNDLICTKNGDYLAILKISGIYCDTKDDEYLNLQDEIRARLFGSIFDSRISVYHTIIRSKLQTADLSLSENTTKNYLADLLLSKNAAYISKCKFFKNEMYITIVLKSQNRKTTSGFIEKIFNSLSYAAAKDNADIEKAENLKIINDIILLFITRLDAYKITRLKTKKLKHGIFSEELEFLNKIINWSNDPIHYTDSDISKYIVKRRLFFGYNGIESRGNTDSDINFGAMLSLKEYPKTTYPGLLDELTTLPIEFIITQAFSFEHKQQSRETIELNLRRLKQSKDPDKSGIKDVENSLGGLVAGDYGFGYHSFTILVRGNSLDEINKNIAEITKCLSACGIIAIRERINTEAAFWSQLPANFAYMARKMLIKTENISSLYSMHSQFNGSRKKNHWGEAVCILETPKNEPYYFNFHPLRSDVGHSVIIGPTGSGKTLLACFLLTNTIKYGSRIFYFDKDYGAECFMRGIGASHSTIGIGKNTGWNPLQLPDTQFNRRFLCAWLKGLLTALDAKISTEDLEIIQNAVRFNYEYIEKNDRNLDNLKTAFGRSGPGTIRSNLEQWCKDGSYSEFFNSPQDSLNLSGRFHCFEMGKIFDKNCNTARPSVLAYLFHRIDMLLEDDSSAPTIICIDEAWSLLSNSTFASNIKNWFKTLRKKNAIVVLLSQEISDLSDSEISNSIEEATVTKIFFPSHNPNQEAYKNIFHLNDREINLLNSYDLKERYFLVKQPKGSAIAKLNANPISEFIPVLSGNKHSINVMHKLLKDSQLTDNKNDWLDKFIEINKNKKIDDKFL